MRKDVLIGLFLIFLPVALYPIAAVQVTRISTVIDTSFALEPGEEKPIYSPSYELYIRCVLTGEVSVEGEAITLTIWGGPSQPYAIEGSIGSIYIDRQYNFKIIPDENAAFTFDNTRGNSTSIVEFLLKEESTKSLIPMVLYLGWFPFAVLMPIGLIVLIVSYYKSSNRLVSP